jgi:aspartate/methionine/tyrosine aminotransferase
VQHAIVAVLEREPDYPKRWLPELKERRDFLVDALRSIDGVDPVTPSGGFFVMAKIAGCTDSRATALALIEQKQVVTIPGRFFGESGEGYLRVSYGAAKIERLRDAVDRITVFFAR